MAVRLVRLDKFLVDAKLADSRTTAQRYIEEGRVSVNGQKNLKPASQVAKDANVTVDAPEKIWASRGAYKLLKGLDVFGIDVDGKTCIDIGASTGGFTDVLLTHGAKRVYAVDVGYGQLAWKLRTNERVSVMERTNARYLTLDMVGGVKADIIVSDASFISLKLLLKPLEDLLAADGRMIVLVKPQFEAGRERVGKGVITDAQVHKDILEELALFVEKETALTLLDAAFSPIRGPEGNIEFLFLLAHKSGEEDNGRQLDFGALVQSAHAEAIRE